MPYKPKYRIEDRYTIRGLPSKAPFITMPNGAEYNISDIPAKEYTSAVEFAIRHAFKLGFDAARMVMNQELTGMTFDRTEE